MTVCITTVYCQFIKRNLFIMWTSLLLIIIYTFFIALTDMYINAHIFAELYHRIDFS